MRSVKTYFFLCKWLLGRGRKTEEKGSSKRKVFPTHTFQAEMGGMRGGLLGKVKGTLKAKGLFTPWVSGTKPLCKATLC